MWRKTVVMGKNTPLLLWWACFRQAGTSAAWCLRSSTWCGPPCSWNAGRGGRLSWPTSGGHWTRRPSPWRNRGLSSGWEQPHSGSLCLFLFLVVSHLTCGQGVKRCSPITGREEFYYPPWRRRLFRWLVSLPVCILCICFVFLVMLICFELQVSQGEPNQTKYLCCGSSIAGNLLLCRSL